MALLLMTTWLRKPPPFANKTYDVVELFAGKGRIGRLAAAAGWHALVHDLEYDRFAQAAPDQHNSMDMCGCAGYLLLSYTTSYHSLFGTFGSPDASPTITNRISSSRLDF